MAIHLRQLGTFDANAEENGAWFHIDLSLRSGVKFGDRPFSRFGGDVFNFWRLRIRIFGTEGLVFIFPLFLYLLTQS